jgi:hypothetical protein
MMPGFSMTRPAIHGNCQLGKARTMCSQLAQCGLDESSCASPTLPDLSIPCATGMLGRAATMNAGRWHSPLFMASSMRNAPYAK